ncbi:MAG: prephenate dehydrogenase/arogenate dehydrogenase family protein [Mariprofundaceae bacterium]|nr:prephenate dehydrogenase/arogenate dehydrogenase family protein [Mariprofundaceae bacterium]
MSIQIKHLVVIGTGLIGGSLALALKRAGCVERVTGVGRSVENLEEAVRLGVIDDFSHDVATAVADADMVFVSTPVAAYTQAFKAMSAQLPEHAIVTDAGSTKQSVVHDAQKYLSHPNRFVPAHPVAGAEHSGVKAAFAELFEKHVCIITPDENTDKDAIEQVQNMWECVGAQITSMRAAEHDDILASVSHLPHLAAFALVNAVRGDDESGDAFRFAAGGFRDFTRIASSSPEMWRDIALCNRDALMQKVDLLQDELKALRVALQSEDGDALLQKFADAKQARDIWMSKYGDKL